MRRPAAALLGLWLALAALPGAAAAQAAAEAGTLADIRRELAALSAEIARLRAELAPGGAAAPVVSGSLLERVDVIEAELARLTARTEELEFRIGRIVQDATNRIANLEFRLTELAGGDPAALPPVPPLGGEAEAAAPPAAAAPEAGAPQLAVGELAEFERARALYDAGDHPAAAEALLAFATTYPGGALAQEALYLRGEALARMGDRRGAARAWLDAYVTDRDGARAADALFRVGESLALLDQQAEACLTFDEVILGYPGTPAAELAQAARLRLGCG